MSNRRVESFLLRLVIQDNEAASTEPWRGRIQHISSGGERQFERVQDLIDFIGEQLGHQQQLRVVTDDRLNAD